MSTIDIDGMFALADALEGQSVHASAIDLIRVMQQLGNDGWHLTRKPEPIVETPPTVDINEGIRADDRPEWMPSTTNRLFSVRANASWTDVSEIHDEHKLHICVGRGDYIIAATGESDALRIYRDRKPDGSDETRHTYGTGVKQYTYGYLWDEIPF